MRKLFALTALFSLPSVVPLSAQADVKLPQLVGSGMVLQRGVELPVWGWADPAEQVHVEFNGHKQSARADEQGQWRITLPAMQAGGPYSMRVRGNNTIDLEDVLIGDVWLASGQSNMELTLARAEPRFPELVAEANNTQIRQFDVPDRYDFKQPQVDLEGGQWQPATPEFIRSFSAVGYFFAEKVQQTEQVPIGIINASMGGSPVEAWMSEDALKNFPEPLKEAQRFRDDQLIEEITRADEARSQAWFAELDSKDAGYDDGQFLWAAAEFNSEDWSTTQVPGYWASNEVGNDDGVVWFRKTVELPEAFTKQPALLVLGAIIDSDQVFVNGVQVGSTGYMYPPRRYSVPPETFKPGSNVISVRVTSQQSRGGFVPDKEYTLRFPSKILSLAGDWQFKRGAVMPPLASQTFIRWKPMGLYNGMIAPLLNYRIKGVIWYQGESNAGRAESYRQRFPAMITDWRQQWQQGQFPFLFVQLSNYVSPGSPRDEEGNWPALRQAQLESLEIPNTAMVVSVDVGEWNDIHPLDKQTIGHRLAAAAMNLAYGREMIYSGPLPQNARLVDDRVELSFSHTGSGLTSHRGKPQGFSLAGKDGQFRPAAAEIKGDRIVLSTEGVSRPVSVRYAWSNNPEQANLFNREGFPASPFQVKLNDQ